LEKGFRCRGAEVRGCRGIGGGGGRGVWGCGGAKILEEKCLDVGAGLGNQFNHSPITVEQNPPFSPITVEQNLPFLTAKGTTKPALLTLNLRIKPAHSPSTRQSINPKPDNKTD